MTGTPRRLTPSGSTSTSAAPLTATAGSSPLEPTALTDRKSEPLHEGRLGASERNPCLRSGTLASMAEADLTVASWKRYGKHRLYVSDAAGDRVGWRDMVTGQDTIEHADRAADFRAAIERHLAGSPRHATTARTDETEGPVATPSIDAAPATPRIGGVAGTSAQRQYERRAASERQRQEAAVAKDAAWRAAVKADRPVLGRLAAALTTRVTIGPETQSTTAWAIGATGEREVGLALEACGGLFLLHDRRKPRSAANIDHIAVSASGVFVIDAKKYEGALEVRVEGPVFRPVERLYVKGRDRTKLLAAVQEQAHLVRDIISDAGVKVTPVLCFVGGDWPLFQRKGLLAGDVRICPPSALGKLAGGDGPLGRDRRAELAATIGKALPSA
jgi:hypothetical protein